MGCKFKDHIVCHPTITLPVPWFTSHVHPPGSRKGSTLLFSPSFIWLKISFALYQKGFQLDPDLGSLFQAFRTGLLLMARINPAALGDSKIRRGSSSSKAPGYGTSA
jgi:hypothetical protein